MNYLFLSMGGCEFINAGFTGGCQLLVVRTRTRLDHGWYLSLRWNQVWSN